MGHGLQIVKSVYQSPHLSLRQKARALPYLLKGFLSRPLESICERTMEWRSRQKLHREYPWVFQNLKVGLLPGEAIGPIAQYGQLHLRYMHVHRLDPQKDVVLVAPEKVANDALLKLIRRAVHVRQDDRLYHLLINGGTKALQDEGILLPDLYPNGAIYCPDAPILLEFNEDEMQQGRSLLTKLGLQDPNQPFVLVNNKDDFYYSRVRGTDKPWDKYRSSDFSSLQSGLDELQKRGIAVIRTGHYPDDASARYLSLNVLDANERKFMDIFLQKECLFSICGASGIGWLPYLFKKPTLYHNYIPIGENPPIENAVLLPKRLTSRMWKNGIPYSELVKMQWPIRYKNRYRNFFNLVSADRFQDFSLYERLGIEISDNTPEELSDAIEETLHLSMGKLQLSSAQHLLQSKFRSCFPLGHPMRHHAGQVSPSFIEKNQNLLA